jgi:hypothetical protein
MQMNQNLTRGGGEGGRGGALRARGGREGGKEGVKEGLGGAERWREQG